MSNAVDETIKAVSDKIANLQNLLTGLHEFKAKYQGSGNGAPTLCSVKVLKRPHGYSIGPTITVDIPRIRKKKKKRAVSAGSSPALPEEAQSSETEPVSPATYTRRVDPDKLTPYSPRGISEVGAKLKETFTAEELGALLPQGKPAAYYWIAQWRNRKWIEKEDYDVYRKTKRFGT